MQMSNNLTNEAPAGVKNPFRARIWLTETSGLLHLNDSPTAPLNKTMNIS